MDKKIIFILVILVIGSAVAFTVNPSDSQIPPTPAFNQLFAGSENITATIYQDNFTVSTHGSLALGITGNTLDLSIEPPIATRLGGVFSGNCAVNFTVTGIDTAGNIVCMALP